MKIRLATNLDIPGMRKVGITAWEDTYTNLVPQGYIISGLKTFWSSEYFEEALRDPTSIVCVVDENNIILGVSQLLLVNQELVHLQKLYISQGARGAGLGKKLLEFTIRSASITTRVCTANVIVGNPALIFYQHIQFKIIAENLEEWFGYSIPLYTLEKQLLLGTSL